MSVSRHSESSASVHPRVLEILQSSGVSFEVISHARFEQPIRSPQDFAEAANCDISSVAKSIVLRSVEPDTLLMVVLPTNASIDLDGVQSALGVASLSLVRRKDVEALTDQEMNGISPVGHDSFTVLIDQGLLAHRSIFVGSGRAGYEIMIAPEELRSSTKARVGSFAKL